MTTALLIVVIVLLVAHEALAWRGGVPSVRRLRAVVLLALLVAVGAFASRAALASRASAYLDAWRGRPALPVPLSDEGDPLLAEALAEQSPVRPYPAGQGRDAIEAWRAHVVGALRTRVEYERVSASSVATTVVGVEQVGDVRRTLLTFTSWDGTRIPAYVHEPAAGHGAAVLVVPGHGAGIRATAGIVDDYQHAAALALARQGFTTLTPELRGFGMLTPDGVSVHRAVAAAALEAGTFYKAVVVKDLGMALTVLGQWRGVDAGRIAVAGASLGGELAVFLGVLDERVAAVASLSYGGAMGPTSIADEVTDEARQTPHGCHTIPGVNRLVWQEDWFRLLAPRPVLLARGTRNTPREAVPLTEAVRDTYAAFAVPAAFSFMSVPGGHEFFVAPTVAFVRQTMEPAAGGLERGPY